MSTLISYYILNIPLCFFFVYQLEWGLNGLWAAITASLLYMVVYFQRIIIKTDWHEVARVRKKELMN